MFRANGDASHDCPTKEYPAMADESDDDLYGDESATQQKKDVKKAEDNSSGDEPMDEESGEDDDSDSVCRVLPNALNCEPQADEAPGHRHHH